MAPYSLTLSNTSAFYGERQILDHVDFTLNSGEFVCLIGKNGAGKTSLMKILANVPDESLRIEKNGSVVKNTVRDYKENARLVSFLPQNGFSAWNYTVFDFVLQGRFCHTNSTGMYVKADKDKTEEILKKLNIANLRNAHVHELSGGEFQKVRIARSLVQESRFLLLDEPLASLDFSYEDEFITLLKNIAVDENRGILISIHNINTASRFCDKLAVLTEDRKLLCGTAAEIMTADILEKIYGKKVNTFTHPDGSIQVY